MVIIVREKGEGIFVGHDLRIVITGVGRSVQFRCETSSDFDSFDLRVGHAVTVAEGIRVAILEVEGECVKVGVHAPPTIQVSRGTSYQRHLHRQKVREKLYAREGA